MNWESQGLRLGSNRKLYMGMWGGVKGEGKVEGEGKARKGGKTEGNGG